MKKLKNDSLIKGICYDWPSQKILSWLPLLHILCVCMYNWAPVVHTHTHKMCIWFCGFELKKGLYMMTWVSKCTYACGGVLLSWNDAVWLRGLYILNPVVNLLTISEQQAWIWGREKKRKKNRVQNQHTRELISTQKTQSTTAKTWVTYGKHVNTKYITPSYKHVNTKYINSILQACKYKVHKLRPTSM